MSERERVGERLGGGERVSVFLFVRDREREGEIFGQLDILFFFLVFLSSFSFLSFIIHLST